MSSERPEGFSEPSVGRSRQTSDVGQTSNVERTSDVGQASDPTRNSETATGREPSDNVRRPEDNDATRQGATVLVRGETLPDQESKSQAKSSAPKDKEK